MTHFYYKKKEEKKPDKVVTPEGDTPIDDKPIDNPIITPEEPKPKPTPKPVEIPERLRKSKLYHNLKTSGCQEDIDKLAESINNVNLPLGVFLQKEQKLTRNDYDKYYLDDVLTTKTIAT